MATPKKLDKATIDGQVRRWARFRARTRKPLPLAGAALAAHNRRMDWWRQARFGMVIHYGLYSVAGRHEWVMNLERWPLADYEKLADGFQPAPGAPRAWARLAREAGMKYVVLTAKHHEGFCLWDTAQTDYNAVRLGPKRDILAEYVQACRDEGLAVGFYYSLMDWHHPDGARCAYDEAARRRFVDFTGGCVRELMSNYGPIDVLWYDVPWPLSGARAWNAGAINRMARRLQPGLIINDRAWLCEDYTTPEEQITPPAAGRDWEACMTMNGSWGWMPSAMADHCDAREVIGRLHKVTAGAGNLLLNIGPAPDGSVPAASRRVLRTVGRWLADNGQAVYGPVDRVANMEWQATGGWTAKGPRTRYYWCNRWAGDTLIFGGIKTKIRRITMLPDGRAVKFTQDPRRVILTGLPDACPDPHAGWVVFNVEFAGPPRQVRGAGCVEITP
ncbi:MAG: alpha-L-fucosidase [Planctomycetes bacterium]|nr:alpha-L-fucosidase [Planctomycetota bacterium]